ncbi:MAG: hypothetical protein HYX61_13200 [Gammaproteobacteria bacterium]|jgi:hypothetical protein|nr:hypothetical protein [Gammaproteobacteria bacterium]
MPNVNEESAVTEISFAEASPLQKSNQIIEQGLSVIHNAGNPNSPGVNSILSVNGIFRQSSKEMETAAFYAKMKKDPTANSLVNSGSFKDDGMQVAGVLKKAMTDVPVWEGRPLEILLENLDIDPVTKEKGNKPIDLKNCIEELIQAGYMEEAKLLHNLMHVSYLVVVNSEKNKATAYNMAAQFFAPQLDRIINVNPNTMEEAAKMGLSAYARSAKTTEDILGINRTESTKNGEEKSFAQTFDQKYPKAANELAHQYKSISQPVKIFGIKMPKFIGNAIKKLTSSKKARNQSDELAKQLRAQTVTALQEKRKSETESKTRQAGFPQSSQNIPSANPSQTVFKQVRQASTEEVRQEPILAQTRKIAHEENESVKDILPPPNFGPPPLPPETSNSDPVIAPLSDTQKLGEQSGVVAQVKQKFENPVDAPRDPQKRQSYIPDGGIAKGKVQELKQIFEKELKSKPDDPDTKSPGTRGTKGAAK